MDPRKKELSVAKRKKMAIAFQSLNKDQETKIFRMICDHAKETIDFVPTMESLPYCVKIVDDQVHVDINKLPKQLKWDLYDYQQQI